MLCFCCGRIKVVACKRTPSIELAARECGVLSARNGFDYMQAPNLPLPLDSFALVLSLARSTGGSASGNYPATSQEGAKSGPLEDVLPLRKSGCASCYLSYQW